MKRLKIISDGIIKTNPTFVLLLGLCSVLATSSTLSSAVGMGFAVIFVLILTNVIISLIRKITPNEIRIPVFVVVIAAVVTIIQMLMEAFTPELALSLGVYLPLIVVNCIIMARAEVFANQNGPLDSFLDAIGIGLGYLLVIVVVSLLREFIGTGGLQFINPFTNLIVFSFKIIPAEYTIPLFSQNTGAFLMLGLLLALINAVTSRIEKGKAKKAQKAEEAVVSEGGQQ